MACCQARSCSKGDRPMLPGHLTGIVLLGARACCLAASVRLFDLSSMALMQVVLKYDAGRGPITALAVTAEDCILAGTQDGCMMVFAPDSRRHITRCCSTVLPPLRHSITTAHDLVVPHDRAACSRSCAAGTCCVLSSCAGKAWQSQHALPGGSCSWKVFCEGPTCHARLSKCFCSDRTRCQ